MRRVNRGMGFAIEGTPVGDGRLDLERLGAAYRPTRTRSSNSGRRSRAILRPHRPDGGGLGRPEP